VHLGSAHSRASAYSAKRPNSRGVSARPRKQGREIPTPPRRRQLTDRIRPVIVGRRENGLGVTPVDGDLDLGRSAAGGSPWWLLYGGGRLAGGDRRGGDGRRSLATGCWGGKAFGVRAVLGVVQMWPEEDRCGLALRRLSVAAV
jgi:hypothetical protein